MKGDACESIPIDEPDFCHWYRWSERRQIPGAQSPGVYALAHFDSAPLIVDPLASDVFYIGQTTEQSLEKRWSDFHRSATTGKGGHSGGRTYHGIFVPDTVDGIHVSAFPVAGLIQPRLGAYLEYIERKLIWEYAAAWNKLPRCNKK